MLCNLRYKSKQVVAHELTGSSTPGLNMKSLISKTVKEVTNIGLEVRVSNSDMASSNKAMWSFLDVCVSRNKRQTFYSLHGNKIHCLADVQYLLKNMWNAFLSGTMILPDYVCKKYDLPTATVTADYLMELWKKEINESKTSVRSLHHLDKV